MRLAVLSDIHGNMTALETVLADIEAAGGADLIWCLGDIAAGAARPAECLRRIKALAEADEGKKFQVIGGNTDRYLLTGERMRAPYAKDETTIKTLAANWQARDTVFNWTLEQLSFEDYEYLKKVEGRELWKRVEGYGYVIGYHAVPGNDETILTAQTSDEETRDLLLDREGCLAIGGHIHEQFDRDLGNWRVVNVGSVGMSIDAPGFAQWGLFTFENEQVNIELRQIPYDVEAAIADLTAVNFPIPAWAEKRLRPAPQEA